MSDGEPPEVTWSGPATPGSPVAAEATQFVAAPLLAGAAVATIGVVGADGAQFRWPGPSMLALTIAATCLLNGIQLALRARHYLYNRGDLEAWRGALGDDSRARRLAMRHNRDFMVWRRINNWSAISYEAGLGMLLLGLAGLVAPPDHASLEHAVCRWCAVGVVVSALPSHIAFSVHRFRSAVPARPDA